MKKILNNLSVSSILVAVVGLVLVIMPSLTNKLIVYGIGIVLLIYGAGRIIRYMKREAPAAMTDLDLFNGLICCATGVFMLIYSSVVIGILPFLYGLFLIFGGARSVQTAFDVKRFQGTRWIVHLVIGIILAVLGILAIRNPFSTEALLTRFVGAGLLAMGIYLFIANRKVNELRSKYIPANSTPDQNAQK